MLGLTPGSLEAYCLDEAVWYFGVTIQHELEKVGHKPSAKEKAAEAARMRIIRKYLEGPDAKGMYADPALLFAEQ